MPVVQPGEQAVAGLPVRRLSPADLAACVELTVDRDWPPEPDKWRLLFAVGEVYGVDDPAGGLAGTVVLTMYGRRLAAVGMMVVASRHGRRGLGRRLLSFALEQADGAVVQLTATSYGLPLYQRLGFRCVATIGRQAGRFRAERPGQPASAPRQARQADLAPVAALDLQVFGADRRALLAELLGFAEVFLVTRQAGAVTGFAAAWRNGDTLIIGPVVAADRAVAISLISSIAADAGGRVRIDIRDDHRWLADWAAARGIAPFGRSTLMVRDGDLPGDRDRLYAPVCVAIG